MRLYCNHEEEAAGISDEEMVDGDANIDDEEMVDGDANIDDKVMVDANIEDNDEDEEMVDANIDDEEMVDANIDDEKMVLGLQSLLICWNSVYTDLELRISLDRYSDRRVCANLQVFRRSFTNVPSPIRSHALPFLLDSRDLIGIAKSGSGETLAFGIPALVHVLCKKKLGDSRRACPWCSILSPTRELAQQIADILCEAEKSCGVKSICLFGGSSKGRHIQGLKSML
ncbi:hypothetical protein Sjap_022072 [Stephania japonica]|uniref:Helicase ATP-binding domain-containing protein n=1 Tax=Stephania japonica TaxID=461633 RepID=A0AAP0EQS8_9MAGN